MTGSREPVVAPKVGVTRHAHRPEHRNEATSPGPTAAALRARAAGARWVFTEERLSAFWAGVPIPPELAVIPAKRLWSGQLTPAQIRACLARYRPEVIWLPERRLQQFELADYLEAHYRPDPSLPDLLLRR